MSTDAAVNDTHVTETSLGPHPVFDTLLSWESEDGWVRHVFGLGHRDALALEPDEVHDPEPVSLITQARLISSTPTGSIRIDQMQLTTDYYGTRS